MAAGRWLTLAIALSAILAVTGAQGEAAKKEAAKKAKAKPEPAIAQGCTKQIPPFCLGVTSGQTTYALFDANPSIPAGIGVTVWGKATGVSPCGTSISVTKWQKNKLKCKA
jgi:hypothetical protein